VPGSARTSAQDRPTHRRFHPLFAECIELGVPFCTQVGHTGPLRPSETERPIPYIDEVALDFPELVIVAGHIGYPWAQEMIAVATKHENVYIDTSAYTVKRYPPELVQYMKTNGSWKVLFGTNYPMITPAKALEGLDDLGLDPGARNLFLGGNAERVFAVIADWLADDLAVAHAPRQSGLHRTTSSVEPRTSPRN
jgi:predicted TIM-barrel fold metal-dependent hydrolase